jgi:hypothetical protein
LEIDEVKLIAFFKIYKHVTDHIEEELWRFYGSGGVHKKTFTSYGDSTTRIDISKPSGNVTRYLWDGTGTDPNFASNGLVVGREIDIQGANFNAANKGVFKITAVSDDGFEVTNASGIAENDKTIGVGYIRNYVEHEKVTVTI